MPSKKKEDLPLVLPPLPTRPWRAEEMELDPAPDLTADPRVVQFLQKPGCKWPGDYLVLCSFLQLVPHPAVPRTHTQQMEHEDQGHDHVDIRNTVMDSRSLTVLLTSVKPIKNIVTLTLFNAGLCSAAIKAMEDLLPLTHIQHLRLDYNPLDAQEESRRAFLCSLVSTSSKLISLSLRGNALGDDAAVILAEELKKGNGALQSLTLFDNRIGDDGASALFSVLETNHQMGEISLASNRLTSGSIAALQQLFDEGHGKSLQILNLSGNCIETDAVMGLLTILLQKKEQLPRLRSLAIHRNKSPVSVDVVMLAKSLEPMQVTI